MHKNNQYSYINTINILECFFRRKMMDILEKEINRGETIINSKKICKTVNALDQLDNMDSIPEVFSIENFATRFNAIHKTNLLTTHI